MVAVLAVACFYDDLARLLSESGRLRFFLNPTRRCGAPIRRLPEP